MSESLQSVVMLVWALVPLVLSSSCYVFFISASLALARSRVTRLEELKLAEKSGAERALRIIELSDRYLLAAQFGRLVSSISAGFSLALVVRSVTRSIGAEHITSQSISFLVSSVVIGGVLVGLLLTVQIAKALSLQRPEQTLCVVARPLSIAFTLFGPLILFAHRVITRILTRFDIQGMNEREIAVSADDIGEIVKMSSEKGTLEKDEQALLKGVVELSDRITREVMTPRNDIVWVTENKASSELVALFTREGVSRVLVCGRDLDDVQGIVLAKDLFPYVGRSVATLEWQTYIRPAYFVPDTKPVKQLLRELRQQGNHLAVVLNEHGGVDGIVTLEDLVEEIVGDIIDEFDAPLERGQLAVRQQDSIFVDGLLPIDRARTEYGIDIPEGEYDTVAGFVLAQLGRLPGEGESVESNGWVFLVTEVHKHRIARLAIKRTSPVPSGDQEIESREVVNAGNRRGR
jgi:putative hemolysin